MVENYQFSLYIDFLSLACSYTSPTDLSLRLELQSAQIAVIVELYKNRKPLKGNF